ncbi:hypothetical protein P3T76_008215 [Phytophthora citrophthora]|uniref:M96 mating-specific protein family n=1 Tax=Phytophthora citrophthora TaxID=4793 RepID=A0AAD9LLE2_9STRA|nr:hypothetical protein P3T76_008215 [Phytophthora citrophthora]
MEEKHLAHVSDAPVSSSPTLSSEDLSDVNIQHILDALEPGLDSFVADNSVPLNAPKSVQPQAPSGTKKPKKRNYDPNKARSERLHELRRLRLEATGLEQKLQQLKMGQNDPNSSLQQKNPSDFVPAVWEEICARQFERRLRAEQENCRLKKKYRVETKMIQSIEKLLFKRFSLQSMSLDAGKSVRRLDIPADFIKDVANRIFEQLEAGNEVSYHEVERILEVKCPIPVDVATRIPFKSEEGLSIELFDRRILPFNLRETSEAWWRRWQHYRGQYCYENMGDVIRERCGLEMADDTTDTTATFYAQQILRRHVEENRVVVVWNAYFEPFTFHDKRVRGVHILFKGYVLMKPIKSADEDATQVVTCYNITPHFSDPKMQEDAETNALVKFVVSATSANISTSKEALENLLVDEALR